MRGLLCGGYSLEPHMGFGNMHFLPRIAGVTPLAFELQAAVLPYFLPRIAGGYSVDGTTKKDTKGFLSRIAGGYSAVNSVIAQIKLSSPRRGGLLFPKKKLKTRKKTFFPALRGLLRQVATTASVAKLSSPRCGGYSLNSMELSKKQQLSSPRCGGYSAVKAYAHEQKLSSPRCGGYSQNLRIASAVIHFLPRVAGVTLKHRRRLWNSK